MKLRHIKTIPEKYGIFSVYNDAKTYIESFKPQLRDEFGVFENLPSLGTLYVPYEYEFTDLIYSGEAGELFKYGREFKKFKIIEVTDNDWTISHWDDHHGEIVIWKKKYDKYLVKGNELINNHEI